MYHVKCSECGWENDRQKKDIIRTKICTHRRIGSDMLEVRHIWSNKRLRNIYRGIKVRCYNPSDKSYKFYGQKGVKLCDEWLDPALFEAWSIRNGYDDSKTIDRIDS